ncbi:unnamed protein product [Callosobruchus maculatus]|uniref:Mitochondrial carrier protein n=1 Tax=Callosobruchus maculatus TaxID=64391 RepID=A0A653BMJ5_CALMS|nr:unnamed protein product [Callosobruchus maculatus]
MNAAPGQYSGLGDVFGRTLREGPQAFFKGIVPSGARILPFNGIAVVLMTQPVDVIKTRLMNAKPGEFKSILHCVKYTAEGGPVAFYKGVVPSAIRLLPATILLFVFYEKLRENFGYLPPDEESPKKINV